MEVESWTLEAVGVVETAQRQLGAVVEAALGSFPVAAGQTAVEDASPVVLGVHSA